MNAHPSFDLLSPYLTKYPQAGGSLFQVYNDIKYSQQWEQIELVELESCNRVGIKGRKPGVETSLYVVPCSLPESISFGWLSSAFASFPSSSIYLAITSEDSSVVYYKISQGIVKPPM
ncbi:hypothetical protein BDN72DRAFT_837902 [Pluteus cervinus]|uniref:Uncharacterized protein n=1 Tax=Pluteus cervinus TaxID=181527 RepID=A0ACD3B0Y5_9AGAR|nr:hypothetical protein BDN72DRAFT_837902 [Pluteus cervinus]